MDTFLKWFYGLLAAAIGGAATALGGITLMSETFNFTHAGWINIGKIAVAGAWVPVLAYLKQSPVPGSLLDPAAGGIQAPGTVSTHKPD